MTTRDSVIEGATTSAPVRLGLSLLRGMRAETADRMEMTRAVRPFVDVANLARRVRPNGQPLTFYTPSSLLQDAKHHGVHGYSSTLP
nr:hypothetical protein [Burkholderia lata]